VENQVNMGFRILRVIVDIQTSTGMFSVLSDAIMLSGSHRLN